MFVELLTAIAPGLVDRSTQVDESRCPATALLREIRPSEKWSAVWEGPHGERPATVASHGLHGRHVDRIDVGVLLAIDLDVDKEIGHHLAGVVVFEAFVGHDVAPMARRVAD